MPPPPFPAGRDIRTYRPAELPYVYTLVHEMDGGKVTIGCTDRDGNMVDEDEASWLDALADGLEGVRRTWAGEWTLADRSAAMALEARLAAAAASGRRDITLDTPRYAPELLDFCMPMEHGDGLSWTFTSFPGDPPSAFGELMVTGHEGRVHIRLPRFRYRPGGQEADSAWLRAQVGPHARPIDPQYGRGWSLSQAQWRRVATAALAIPTEHWQRLRVHHAIRHV